MLSYLHITLKYFINVLKLAASDILCGIIVCKLGFQSKIFEFYIKVFFVPWILLKLFEL